jgi:hypothetical protein
MGFQEWDDLKSFDGRVAAYKSERIEEHIVGYEAGEGPACVDMTLGCPSMHLWVEKVTLLGVGPKDLWYDHHDQRYRHSKPDKWVLRMLAQHGTLEVFLHVAEDMVRMTKACKESLVPEPMLRPVNVFEGMTINEVLPLPLMKEEELVDRSLRNPHLRRVLENVDERWGTIDEFKLDIKWWRRIGFDVPVDHGTMRAAARGGNVDVALWLHDQLQLDTWEHWTLVEAAAAGHTHFLDYVRGNKGGDPMLAWGTCHPQSKTDAGWVRATRINGVRLMPNAPEYAHRCPYSVHVGFAAGANGRLEVVKWLLRRVVFETLGKWDLGYWHDVVRADSFVGDGMLERVCCGAALGGHLDILKWARDWGETGPKGVVLECAREAVAQRGETYAECVFFYMLKFSSDDDERGYNHEVTRKRAVRAATKLTEWCARLTLNLPTTSELCHPMDDYRLRGDEWTTASAAAGGHFLVLQWLVARGCMWTEEVCIAAAGRGDMTMLRWACEHNCPMTAAVIRVALPYTSYDGHGVGATGTFSGIEAPTTGYPECADYAHLKRPTRGVLNSPNAHMCRRGTYRDERPEDQWWIYPEFELGDEGSD